jgi:hypothetical protein
MCTHIDRSARFSYTKMYAEIGPTATPQARSDDPNGRMEDVMETSINDTVSG